MVVFVLQGWAAFVNLTTTGFAGGVRPEEVPTGAKKFFKSLWGSVKSVMPGVQKKLYLQQHTQPVTLPAKC